MNSSSRLRKGGKRRLGSVCLFAMAARQVLPGVTLIDLPLVNVWLLHAGSEGVLIDTGTYWDRRKLQRAIRDVLGPDGHIVAVLQTHGHCDHAGNTAHFCGQGARLYAHKLEIPHLSS